MTQACHDLYFCTSKASKLKYKKNTTTLCRLSQISFAIVRAPRVSTCTSKASKLKYEFYTALSALSDIVCHRAGAALLHRFRARYSVCMLYYLYSTKVQILTRQGAALLHRFALHMYIYIYKSREFLRVGVAVDEVAEQYLIY